MYNVHDNIISYTVTDRARKGMGVLAFSSKSLLSPLLTYWRTTLASSRLAADLDEPGRKFRSDDPATSCTNERQNKRRHVNVSRTTSHDVDNRMDRFVIEWSRPCTDLRVVRRYPTTSPNARVVLSRQGFRSCLRNVVVRSFLLLLLFRRNYYCKFFIDTRKR